MATTDEIDRLVEYFCFDNAAHMYGPFKHRSNGPSRTMLIKGRLWRYRLRDAVRGTPVDLQVYEGLGDIGGALWEQELRLLFRLSGSGTRGVPEVLGGGFQDEEATRKAGVETRGVAFVATRGSGQTMAHEDAGPFMRAHPELAVNRFSGLLSTLAELHDAGVSHRNLTPGALYATDDEPPRLWIARFEMSTLIGNLLDNAAADAYVDTESLRRFFLDAEDGTEPLHYCPPERQAFLFGEPSDLDDHRRSDLYALATIVWEWFFDPAELPAVPGEGAGTAARREALARRRELMRRAAGQSAAIPARLGTLLGHMLAEDPDDRPSAHEADERLRQDRASVTEHWAAAQKHDRPGAVIYMPNYSDATLYKWGWLTHRSATAEGSLELATVIAEDLRHAQILHVPRGADPYVRGGRSEDKKAAQYALVGGRAVWFCQLYRKKVFGREGPPDERALIIKYVVERDHSAARRQLDNLVQSRERFPLPAVELLPSTISAEAMPEELDGRPSWRPLMEAVHSSTNESDDDLRDQRLLEWTLEYQGARLQARWYPYTLVEGAGGGTELQYDSSRDRDRIRRSALLTKMCGPRLRQGFGDFFGDLEAQGLSQLVQVCPDFHGQPDWREGTRDWRLADRVGADRVTVAPMREHQRTRPPRLPGVGWIRPSDDRGTQSALYRQTAAYWELADSAVLLSHLRKPLGIRTLPHRWSRAGADLKGDTSRQVVREMLSFQPFFAVQGPPGTGKTTLVAEAVHRYLALYPESRILISAQSGYALDNLAERVLHRLGALDGDGRPSAAWPGVAIRVAAQEGQGGELRVSPEVQPWLREVATVREMQRVRDRVAAVLHEIPGSNPIRPVLERWQKGLDTGNTENMAPEFGDRLRRSANIVFATCAMATAENVAPGGPRDQFDWVILEEAAKAWTTELAIPLARGSRWTLIGDHEQLGAFGREEFEQFVEGCADDPDPEFAAIYEDRKDYLGVFDAFRRVFAYREAPDLTEQQRNELPLRRLETQYRMRKPIADAVGTVFYPRARARDGQGELPFPGLVTGREVPASPVRSPVALRGRSLVWLDTEDIPECADEPRWCNPGEAKLVRRLYDAMRPAPEPGRGGYTEEALAVLTPYQQQVKELRDAQGLGSIVHTIHSFQGREADVVLVSMVRDTPRGNALASIGHLAQANLINVMMSRARKLLVVVGDLGHFQAVAATDPDHLRFWERLALAFHTYGDVLSAAEVLEEES